MSDHVLDELDLPMTCLLIQLGLVIITAAAT